MTLGGEHSLAKPDLKVFRVVCDIGRYPEFSFRINGRVPEVFQLRDGLLLEHWWIPPHVSVSPKDAPPPDIWRIAGTRLLILAFDVAESLMPYAAMAGQLLPVQIEGEPAGSHVALAITNEVDALKSESGHPVRADFIAHRLGEPTLFIVPQLHSEIFCIERSAQEDSLIRRTQANAFTGLIFEEVWSN